MKVLRFQLIQVWIKWLVGVLHNVSKLLTLGMELLSSLDLGQHFVLKDKLTLISTAKLLQELIPWLERQMLSPCLWKDVSLEKTTTDPKFALTRHVLMFIKLFDLTLARPLLCCYRKDLLIITQPLNRYEIWDKSYICNYVSFVQCFGIDLRRARHRSRLLRVLYLRTSE